MVDALCLYIWAALTSSAVFTYVVPIPFIRSLVLHGKLIGSPKDSALLIPKSWFNHFYMYGICALFILCPNTGSFGWLLLLVHLMRRLIEEVWLFPVDETSRMHVGAYMLGFLFYTLVAFSVAARPSSALLWFLGNCIQHVAHSQLFHNRIRDPTKRKPPRTFLFRYMNCPHYFGEMLIYVGLASFDRIESVACALFVIISLSVNWYNHSCWYSSQAKS